VRLPEMGTDIFIYIDINLGTTFKYI